MANAALREKWGDLGRVTGQLRDGNHRMCVAQLRGEPWLWVYVTRGYEGPLTEDDLE